MRCLFILLTLILAVPGFARTPAPGTPERKAVLDALRPSVEAELGPRIEFVVQEMQINKEWAFVQAKPQRRGGGRISWRTYYSPTEWQMMDGLTVTALLKFQKGRWNLIERQVGATDAWYCGKAPRGLIAHC